MKIKQTDQDIKIIYTSKDVDVTTIKREGGRWIASIVDNNAKEKKMAVTMSELSGGLSQAMKDLKNATKRVKTIKALLKAALEAEELNDFNDDEEESKEEKSNNKKSGENQEPPF